MVNEQQENEGKEPTKTEEDSNNGSNSQSLTIVERARDEREKLEQENVRLERNIKELRDLEASRLLGSSAGGHVAPQPPKKLSNVEYAQKFMRGEANPLEEDGISIN